MPEIPEFKEVMAVKRENIRHEQNIKKLTDLEQTVVSSIQQLVKYLDGKVTKTEVVNQLKSISTPDIDKVVDALNKLDENNTKNKLDISPLNEVLTAISKKMDNLPTSFPEAPEQLKSVSIDNLSDIDYKPLEKAIKALKLDPKIEVKAGDVKIDAPDLKPLQDSLLDLLKAVKAQEFPQTDLSAVEKKLDESNKHLKKLIEKPVGGGGGGGSGTSYTDATGKLVYVQLNNGTVPVSLTTINYKTLVDKATTNIIYIGKAVIGTATNSPAWLIKKVDKTVTDNITITYAASGASTATWTNRGSEVYS